MVPGCFDIICCLVLEREHSGYVHVPGSCHEVVFVVVLCREFVCNQVAAVVQIQVFDLIRVFHGMPTAWFDTSDRAAFFGRKCFRAKTGAGSLTSDRRMEDKFRRMRLSGRIHRKTAHSR